MEDNFGAGAEHCFESSWSLTAWGSIPLSSANYYNNNEGQK